MKLVTSLTGEQLQYLIILIHTSVKLVTLRLGDALAGGFHFNPHEREARDLSGAALIVVSNDILIHTSVKLVTPCRRTDSPR